MLGYSGAWKILFALVICDHVDCPESVVDSLSDSASDSFCEIEHLLSMVYFPRVIIIINNNTGNEVLSEPLLKIFLEEFGW